MKRNRVGENVNRGRRLSCDLIQGDAMTDDKRAFELHNLALSVVRAMGRPVAGDNSVLEHRLGRLTIRYWPRQQWLDVICNGHVLTVERWAGALQVKRYFPGGWELTLARAAQMAA